MSVPRIDQAQFVAYSLSGFPYRGYVEGLGFVDSMNKGFLQFSDPFDPNAFSYNSAMPQIAYAQTLDSSPGSVIRSHEDLSGIFLKALCRDAGKYVDVNLGNGVHKQIDKSLNPRFELNVKDPDEEDSKVWIRVSYGTADDGEVIESEHELDAMFLDFPDAGLQKYYMPYDETYGQLAEVLDVTDSVVDVAATIQTWSSNVLSPIYEVWEPHELWKYKNELYQFEKDNLKTFVNSEGKTRNYFKKNHPGEFSCFATKERYEADLKARTDPIWDGSNEKVKAKSNQLKNSKFNKLCTGLNWLGLGVSVYELISYSVQYDPEISSQKEMAMRVGDVVFSALAFIPGYGCALSLLWFYVRATNVDPLKEQRYFENELPHATYEFDPDAPGLIGHFSSEMKCSGMRRDNTVTKPFDEDVLRSNIEYEDKIRKRREALENSPFVKKKTNDDITKGPLFADRNYPFAGMPKGRRY